MFEVNNHVICGSAAKSVESSRHMNGVVFPPMGAIKPLRVDYIGEFLHEWGANYFKENYLSCETANPLFHVFNYWGSLGASTKQTIFARN